MNSSWDEEDKMGYVLSRTGKNVRALIQTGCLEGEYSTAQDMLQPLAIAYNDPQKKAKARALYRDVLMGEQERFENFMSKCTAYTAQAGITNSTMKQEDLIDKVTKPLRDGIHPCLSLYPTFTDLEAEKKRSTRDTTTTPHQW